MNDIKNRWTSIIIAEGNKSVKELAEENKANLVGANLARANLARANLARANLVGADLVGANLVGADLVEANLARADLVGANLVGADLMGANLTRAYLGETCLEGANLEKVNFEGANLVGANFVKAKIEFCQFPSIRTLSSLPLKNIQNELILELMRWDAQAHPNPDLFDDWAKGGYCPYKNEERWWWIPEKREVWQPGNPKMRLSDLVLEICRQEGWGIKGYLEIKTS